MERLTYEIIDGGMVTDKENIKEFEIEDGFMVCGGNAIFRLSAYEDTGLTPEQIMELKESVQRLDKIFGAEITVDQVIDFFVDFYIAQGDPDRAEAAELLTNEEVARYRELKERDKPRKIELNAGVPTCPVCGRRVVRCYDFCPDCGQRLEQ